MFFKLAMISSTRIRKPIYALFAIGILTQITTCGESASIVQEMLRHAIKTTANILQLMCASAQKHAEGARVARCPPSRTSMSGRKHNAADDQGAGGHVGKTVSYTHL